MKLFVGSLPFELTDKELEELFQKAGSVVSAKVIFDRVTGRSKGFGFVEMSSSQEGKKAIDELDGFSVNGRTIVVKKALDKERTPGTGGNSGGNFGGNSGGYNRDNRDRDPRSRR